MAEVDPQLESDTRNMMIYAIILSVVTVRRSRQQYNNYPIHTELFHLVIGGDFAHCARDEKEDRSGRQFIPRGGQSDTCDAFIALSTYLGKS